MKIVGAVAILSGVVGLFLLGRCTASWGADEPAVETVEANKLDWICPMHPTFRRSEPGLCGVCGMPLERMTDDAGPRQVALSRDATKLAGIRTAPVERRFVTMPIRIVGKVEYDETRVRTIAARVPGRLDRLYVDYTGISVKKSDHLVWLYSPELLEAQQELLGAKKRFEERKGKPSEFLGDSDRRGYESAREKLLLWGLTVEQVDEIETRGTAEDHMMIRSPSSGVVVHKDLNEGDYVKEGSPIYRIADLSHLWVLLDAYEQDLPWLRYGQSVTVQTEAYPGRVFEGLISFLDPIVSETTRTVKVRVNITNTEGVLKPGMFVRAVVQSRLGDEGGVIAPGLAGKWISPMHPEIVKDGPGQCDVCGMDLVPAAELGLVDEEALEKPLVVPASAVLVTGVRAVVYVEVPGEKPTFEGREVILGPRAGDFYIVRAGLTEKDRVVVNGAFRIDSAMQIRGKRSMMPLAGDADTYTGPETAVLRASLEPVYDAYLRMQQALAADDAEAARHGGVELGTALDGVRAGGVSREARVRWEEESVVLRRETRALAEGASLAELRGHFSSISRSVLTLEKTFRHVGSTRYEAFCPMAFDNQGGAWLQGAGELANPYFGSSMPRCGEVRQEWPGVEQQLQKATEEDPARDPERQEKTPKEETPPEKPPPEKNGDEEPEAVADSGPVYDAYFALQAALAADSAEQAATALSRLDDAVGAIDSRTPSWSELGAAVAAARDQRSLEPLRVSFQRISNSLLAVHADAGHGGGAPFYRVHCPMAFGNAGADWLQREKVVSNPYFGASMLRCGSIEGELSGRGEGR